MRYLTLLLLIVSFVTSYCQTYTVETVPNTKLTNNSYVSNPDNILSEYTVSQINSILTDLESQTTAQVAVVAIQSIGNEDIFDFAQELFNKWGIGQAKTDNGLLMLLVIDKRIIRLHTGYGLEGDLPDIVCKHIETRKMVPHFKNSDYDNGILAGVIEVDSILTNAEYSAQLKSSLAIDEDIYTDDNKYIDDPIRPSEFIHWPIIVWSLIMIGVYFYNRSKGIFTDSSGFKAPDGPHIKTSGVYFIFWFIILPVGIMASVYLVDSFLLLIGAFYGYLFLASADTQFRLSSVYRKNLEKKEFHAMYLLLQEKLSLSLLSAIFIPIPFIFVYFKNKKRLSLLREHPRECSQCGKPATKLTEQKEDPFLNKQQIFEENLKSVDYDVWKCSDCGAPQVFRYPNPSTHFEECQKCGTVAYYVSSTKTIKAATESREGLKEEVKLCKYCKFRSVRTYAIPKLSSSSSSGGGSSGGSWGGGSSGGGGASSSW